MILSKFLTILGITIVLTVSGVNIIPFTSTSFNASKAEAAITIRNDYVWMDMPQTGNQNDNWSCGPTSAARVINFYGHNVNRDSLVNAINKDFVIPPSFNVPAPTVRNPFRKRRVDIRTGTTPHALRDVMKRWEGDNVKLERKADFNKLLGLLRQGKPVVVLLRVGSTKIVGTTWPEMHWITVNGFSASGQKIYFTETSDGITYEYSYDEFQSKWDWRVGKGLASEALYKNGVEPKTMIWVDRVPPVVAQSQRPPSEPVHPTYSNLTSRVIGCYSIRSLNSNFRNSNFRWLDAKSDDTGVGLVSGQSHGTVWLLEEANQSYLLRSTNQNHRSTNSYRWLDSMSNGTGVQLVSDTSHGAFWRLEQVQGGYHIRSLNNNFSNDNPRWLDGASNGATVKLVNGTSHGTLWELTSTTCP